MNDVVVIGHGGFAKEVMQYLEDINNRNSTWNILGFCSQSEKVLGEKIGDYFVVQTDKTLQDLNSQCDVVIGIGFPLSVQRVSALMKSNKYLLYPNIIHPSSYLSSRIIMGCGNTVCPGVVMSVDLSIGSHNLFNWNVTVGHDTLIGDCNVFNPSCNVSGSVIIGTGVFVGTGVQILQGISICSNVTIGAGAVVTKDITEPGTYIGIPAKRIK